MILVKQSIVLLLLAHEWSIGNMVVKWCVFACRSRRDSFGCSFYFLYRRTDVRCSAWSTYRKIRDLVWRRVCDEWIRLCFFSELVRPISAITKPWTLVDGNVFELWLYLKPRKHFLAIWHCMRFFDIPPIWRRDSSLHIAEGQDS